MVRLVIYIIDTIHVEQTQKYFLIEIGGPSYSSYSLIDKFLFALVGYA